MDKDTSRQPYSAEKNIAFVDSTGWRARGVVILDGAGNHNNDLSGYKISITDADATPKYYGKERADGAWYIMKEEVSAGNDIYTYAAGDSDFATNWGNRASLSYDTVSNTF